MEKSLYLNLEFYIKKTYEPPVFYAARPAASMQAKQSSSHGNFLHHLNSFFAQEEETEEESEAYETEELVAAPCASSLKEKLDHVEESFSEMLLRKIDEKEMSDVEVYKKANIDRRLFSKIRSNKYYQPSKNTAILLAMATECNLDEALDLLGKAGFTLSHSSKSDIIVEYFLNEENYDILLLNEALDAFHEKPLF